MPTVQITVPVWTCLMSIMMDSLWFHSSYQCSVVSAAKLTWSAWLAGLHQLTGSGPPSSTPRQPRRSSRSQVPPRAPSRAPPRFPILPIPRVTSRPECPKSLQSGSLRSDRHSSLLHYYRPQQQPNVHSTVHRYIDTGKTDRTALQGILNR